MQGIALLMFGYSTLACSGGAVDPLQDAAPTIDGPLVGIDARFEPWQEPDYAARIPFHIDNGARSTLENFPLAVRFLGNQTRMGEDGERIVFHNGTQRLAHEVERIGLESLVWVRTDLAGLSTIWMYFDAAETDSLSSGPDTFSEFESVYHFYDSYDENRVERLDDALNNNNLNVSGLDSDIHAVEGIGRAVRYPLNSQFFAQSVGAVPALTVDDGQALSYEAWFKVPAGTADRTVISNFSDDCEGMHVFFGNGTPDVSDGSADAGEGILHAGFFTADQCNDTSADRALLITDNRLDDNQWHHIAFTIDRGMAQVELFLDGVISGNTTGGAMTGRTTNFPLRLGNNPRNQFEALDGILDEVRIGEIRSADWYQATFRNAHPKSNISNPVDFVTAAAIEERP